MLPDYGRSETTGNLFQEELNHDVGHLRGILKKLFSVGEESVVNSIPMNLVLRMGKVPVLGPLRYLKVPLRSVRWAQNISSRSPRLRDESVLFGGRWEKMKQPYQNFVNAAKMGKIILSTGFYGGEKETLAELGTACVSGGPAPNNVSGNVDRWGAVNIIGKRCTASPSGNKNAHHHSFNRDVSLSRISLLGSTFIWIGIIFRRPQAA